MSLPDLSSVTDIASYKPKDAAEQGALIEFSAAAREYLQSFSWLDIIRTEYVGAVFPGILGMFLYEIKPASGRADVDPALWIIVGDLPSAYLTCDECRNPWEALDGYIGAMEQWVEAASAGKSVKGIIPVNVPATTENAEILGRRLKFLDKRIMPLLKARLPS